MKRTTIAIVAVVLLAGLAGCTGSSGEEPTSTPAPAETGEETTLEGQEDVTRFVDAEAGVVCYKFDAEGASASGAGWNSGISCVPLNQTELSEDY